MSARSCLLIVATLIPLLAGCHDSAERLNAPPQGPSDKPHALQPNMTFMVDNAMLHDLAVADIHFVPHRAELSTLGVRRLNRYVELLAIYGGTLHYETDDPGAELVQGRIDKVKSFLADAGVDMKKVTVEAGPSQGRGAPASDALKNLEEGTAVQEGAGSSSSGGSSQTVRSQ